MTRTFKFRTWDTIGKQWLQITGVKTAETFIIEKERNINGY